MKIKIAPTNFQDSRATSKITNEADRSSAIHKALIGPRVSAIVIMGILLLILFTAFEYAFPELVRGKYVVKDFDAFFVAGWMFWEGRLEDAYFAKSLIAAQKEILGVSSFMPWTYPPHFNILTGLLALAPIWLGYIIFTTFTLLFYVVMLRKITPSHFLVVLIFTFPAVLICVRSGQNGFLIAGLIAVLILNIENSKVKAITSLALISIKPHFLPVLYLLAALRGQWLVVAGGIFGTVLLLLTSSFIFGLGIWPAFQNAVTESSIFLREGFYRLYRMTSLYSALHTLGIPANIALTAQVILAVMAAGAVLCAKNKNWPRKQIIAIAVMSSLFVSPYAYDYDLQIFGVALALLMQDLWQKASGKQLLLLLAGCWLSSASLIFEFSDHISQSELRKGHLALNFWFLILMCLYSLRIVTNDK